MTQAIPADAIRFESYDDDSDQPLVDWQSTALGLWEVAPAKDELIIQASVRGHLIYVHVPRQAAINMLATFARERLT